MYARRTKVGHDPSSPLGDSASAPPQRAVAARGGGKNRLYRLAIRVWACRVKCWGTFRGGTLHERTSHPNLGDEGVSKYDDSGSAPLRQPVPPPPTASGRAVRRPHRREDSEHVHTSARRRYHAGAANSYKCVCGWIRSSGPHAPRPTHESRRRFASVPRSAAGETERQTTNAEGRSHAPISRPCAACALNQNNSTTPKHASRSLLPCTD